MSDDQQESSVLAMGVALGVGIGGGLGTALGLGIGMALNIDMAIGAMLGMAIGAALGISAGVLIENHRRPDLRTFAITATVLCLGVGVAAVFPDAALATLYFSLYPLGVFVMVSAIVGVLVLGRFVVEKIWR